MQRTTALRYVLRCARETRAFVMAGHSRSQNGVAEPVIGPATSGRTRWLAYAGHPDYSGMPLPAYRGGPEHVRA